MSHSESKTVGNTFAGVFMCLALFFRQRFYTKMKILYYSYLCEHKNVLFSDIKYFMQFLLFIVLQMQVIWVWRAKDDKLSL